MNQKIVDLMADLEDDELLEEVKKELAEGVDAKEIIAGLQKGLEIVGQRYAEKEYFISDLMMSADMFNDCSELFGDTEEDEDEANYIGTFMIGTVETDIHYIGKNIVISILKTNGFKVIDLGENVPVARFAEAAEEYKPDIIGMSCLLTTAFEPMKKSIEAIRAKGIDTPILIGGGIVDDLTVDYVHATARCEGPQDDVRIAKQLLGVK